MKTSTKARHRYALATTLAVGASTLIASLQVSPVWADPTPLGTEITNKATATFTDGTTTYDTISNVVVISVSEIAGIALRAGATPTVSPLQGQIFSIEYTITNIGNDPTQFFIPGQVTFSNPGNFSQSALTDATQIEIIAVNGVALSSGPRVSAVGGETGALLGATLGSILPGKTVTIRVPVQVSLTAPTGATTTVTIGQTLTAPPDPETDTRSSDRAGNINNSLDIYTFDNTTVSGATGETNATSPTNGVREAMVTSGSIAVGSNPQTFATVLKTASYSPGLNPNALADDLLTYSLALRVENPTTPPTGLIPADLHGTLLTVTGAPGTARYVLVSDAIPAGLQLAAANPTATGLATGWIPVYSQTPIATSTALTATWTTTRPATGITRVGFIYDTIAKGALSRGTAPAGNLITGFTIVTTPTAAFTGGSIANIAQTFGQSASGPVLPGTPTQLVYDESGDQTSNNGLDGIDPTNTTLAPPAGGGGITDGIANPTTDGSDPGNNSGTDGGTNGSYTKGGEDTIVTIATTPLNGPAGQPGAIGPTNNNDDFTNKSIVVPSGIDPATPLTDAQTPAKIFDNTVQNTGGGPQVISLIPTPPMVLTDLPIGTLVTIKDPATGGATATYKYDGSIFVFESGTGGTSKDVPVRLTIPAGAMANYQTIVDLPAAPTVVQFKSFPVPITAFIDGGTIPNGWPDATEPRNITINRLYTNYLKLFKEARILEANGTAVTGAAGTFGIEQTVLSAAAISARIIEYRITYSNISSSGGTNNALLPANNLVITENGSAGSNTWGTTTLDPQYLTKTIGSAIDTFGTVGSIVVTTGGSPVNITEYKSTVTTVAPGVTGFFTFQRQIK